MKEKISCLIVCVFNQGLSEAWSYDAGVFPAAWLGEA